MNTTKGDILAERIEAIMATPHVFICDGGRLTPQGALRAALAEYRAPWTLGRSVNGFTLGEGQEWHRKDWTQDMLPVGWRPLLLGECRQEGDYNIFIEATIKKDWVKDEKATLNWDAHRTRRPLPAVAEKWAAEKQAFKEGKKVECRHPLYDPHWAEMITDVWPNDWEYRVKPEPVMVELGPEDVPPGSSLLPPNTEPIFWRFIVEIESDCVHTKAGFVYFSDMKKEGWLIHRPGTLTEDGKPLFVRCEKEAK